MLVCHLCLGFVASQHEAAFFVAQELTASGLKLTTKFLDALVLVFLRSREIDQVRVHLSYVSLSRVVVAFAMPSSHRAIVRPLFVLCWAHRPCKSSPDSATRARLPA